MKALRYVPVLLLLMLWGSFSFAQSGSADVLNSSEVRSDLGSALLYKGDLLFTTDHAIFTIDTSTGRVWLQIADGQVFESSLDIELDREALVEISKDGPVSLADDAINHPGGSVIMDACSGELAAVQHSANAVSSICGNRPGSAACNNARLVFEEAAADYGHCLLTHSARK